MTSPGCKDGFLEIGVVGKPHGVHGRIKIVLHNADSDALSHLKKIHLEKSDQLTDYLIEEISGSPRGPSVLLKGMRSREQAEHLRGSKVLVRRTDLDSLEPGEFYVADLIGLEVLEGSNALGHITASREQGGVEVVTVTGADGSDFDLPLADDFIVKIDFGDKRVLAKDTDLLPRSKAAGNRRGIDD